MGITKILFKKLSFELEWACVIQLGFAFMCVFTGFDTQAFIGKSALHSLSISDPNRIQANGYIGMAITYLSFTLANLFTPTIVDRVGARWSMFIASLFYTAFMVTFTIVNTLFYYVMSGLMGASAALLWNGHGVYIKEISSSNNESRNAAIHWSMVFVGVFIGGIMLIFIFDSVDSNELMSKQQIRYIFLGLSAFTILSNILFLFLPNSAKRVGPKQSVTNNFKTMSYLLLDYKIWLLIPSFIHIGFLLALYISVYPACLMFGKNLIGESNKLIAYHCMSFGFGEFIGGIFVGLMCRYYKNFAFTPSMLIAAPISLFAFAGTYLSFPSNVNFGPSEDPTIIKPNLVLWLTIGFLLALGDSLWNTIGISIIATHFKINCSHLFALCKIFQAIATCTFLILSNILKIPMLMLLMILSLTTASVSFAILMYILSKNKFHQQSLPTISTVFFGKDVPM